MHFYSSSSKNTLGTYVLFFFLIQVFFYDGSIKCFQSSHLGVSIFATVGVVLVFLFPVLILIISFRTYKVSQIHNVVNETYKVVVLYYSLVYPTIH